MSQARPRIKPKIRDKSNRGNLAKRKESKKELIPKKANKLSAVERRSKKKVKGRVI